MPKAQACRPRRPLLHITLLEMRRRDPNALFTGPEELTKIPEPTLDESSDASDCYAAVKA